MNQLCAKCSGKIVFTCCVCCVAKLLTTHLLTVARGAARPDSSHLLSESVVECYEKQTDLGSNNAVITVKTLSRLLGG